MSVPPPPAPRKFVSKLAPSTSLPAPVPSSPPAMFTPSSTIIPPLQQQQQQPTSIMKRSPPSQPAPPPQQQPSAVASLPPSSISLSQAAKLQILVDELTRENKHLHRRIARFLDRTNPEVVTAEEVGASDTALDRDEMFTLLDESSPPSLLVARIRRLELALQIESMERDELETKCGVQNKVIAQLLKKIPQ